MRNLGKKKHIDRDPALLDTHQVRSHTSFHFMFALTQRRRPDYPHFFFLIHILTEEEMFKEIKQVDKVHTALKCHLKTHYTSLSTHVI